MHAVLHFAVGPAIVLIQPDASGMLVGTTRNLTCTIVLTNVDDFIVMVHFSWSSDHFKPLFPPRITASHTMQSGNQSVFNSRLIFNPVLSNDTAPYRCIVTVNADFVDAFVSPTTFANTSSIEVQCKLIPATPTSFLNLCFSLQLFLLLE